MDQGISNYGNDLIITEYPDVSTNFLEVRKYQE